MIGHRLLNLRILLLTLLLSCLLLFPIAVRAAPDQAEQEHKGRAHDLIQGPHVEGHIAFLHAELRITPAQEPLWASVAAAMRDDVAKLQASEDHTANSDNDENAVQYLRNRTHFAELRAEGENRFLKAFQPLYESLSGDQKRMADELFIQHGQN